ncbi:DUF3999 family protein [Labilibacter sediminis]|nr:DUF3999 family protein [Labilibacter sediminis]
MRISNQVLVVLLILCCSFAKAQTDQFKYKRDIKGVSEPWHKIVLPNEMFGKLSPNMADIRIYGITADIDTIEIPYLLQELKDEFKARYIDFKLLNETRNGNGYYYTFKIPQVEKVNRIELDFKQDNFDWKVNLQGSNDQQEWFMIEENYRILSVKKGSIDFRYCKLDFSPVQFKYFRLLVKSKKKPSLNKARVVLKEYVKGKKRNYVIAKTTVSQNEKHKLTEISIDMEKPVAVSGLHINVADTLDYYRPVTIKYVKDSVQTEQGWIYNYVSLASGTLNSLGKNDFQFRTTILQNLKVQIQNFDNQPLSFNAFSVYGYEHELQVRFNGAAKYFLSYGNSRAPKPDYDITHFTNHIPDTLTVAELMEEEYIAPKESLAKPLFMNKAWLWTILAVLIGLLAWFGMHMMRK